MAFANRWLGSRHDAGLFAFVTRARRPKTEGWFGFGWDQNLPNGFVMIAIAGHQGPRALAFGRR